MKLSEHDLHLLDEKRDQERQTRERLAECRRDAGLGIVPRKNTKKEPVKRLYFFGVAWPYGNEGKDKQGR
jgi:hypothetical protein